MASGRKLNKILVDKGSEIENRSMKSLLQDNAMEICSEYNKGKPDVAEKCIRTLKNKIYKYMISISKNLYIEKLDDKEIQQNIP